MSFLKGNPHFILNTTAGVWEKSDSSIPKYALEKTDERLPSDEYLPIKRWKSLYQHFITSGTNPRSSEELFEENALIEMIVRTKVTRVGYRF